MQRKQRYRYDMLVRVRDYGMAHKEVFPEASSGGQAVARVTRAVAAVDEHMKAQVLAKEDSGRVKAATRAAVYDYVLTGVLLRDRRRPGRAASTTASSRASRPLTTGRAGRPPACTSRIGVAQGQTDMRDLPDWRH